MSIVMSLLFLIGLAAVIFVVSIAVRNQKTEGTQNEGESKRMVKHLYYYLVLFATLMMSIGGSVGIFMSVADYVSPSSYYQSFEEYEMMKKDPALNPPPATEEELKASYEEMVQAEKQRAKDNALNGIIKSFGWVVIPLPVFFYFQRLIRKKEGI